MLLYIPILRLLYFTLILVLTSGVLSVSTWAQTTLPSVQTSQAQPVELDNSARNVEIQKSAQNQVIENVNSLSQERDKLELELLDLKKQKSLIEAALDTSQLLIDEYTLLINKPDTKNNPQNLKELETKIADIKSQQSSYQKQLVDINASIAEKERRLDTTRQTISQNQVILEQRTAEVDNALSRFNKDVVNFFTQFSIYILAIIGFWIIQILLRNIINRFVGNEVVKTILHILIGVAAIMATIVTIVVGFSGNIPFLLSTIGVLSAALVVALQDFVSSFFAWIMIKTRGQYKSKDTIHINTDKELLVGQVMAIGIFRTTIKEKVGGNSPDMEQFTGRIVSFPNNLLLRQGVTNYTKNDLIQWHDLKLTITFESDHKLAKLLLHHILDEEFKYAVDHKDTLLDNVYNLKTVYKPRIYVGLADNGVRFNIWFACRIEHYREIIEHLTDKILENFDMSSIDLAYPTQRVLHTYPPDTSKQKPPLV